LFLLVLALDRLAFLDQLLDALAALVAELRVALGPELLLARLAAHLPRLAGGHVTAALAAVLRHARLRFGSLVQSGSCWPPPRSSRRGERFAKLPMRPRGGLPAAQACSSASASSSP